MEGNLQIMIKMIYFRNPECSKRVRVAGMALHCLPACFPSSAAAAGAGAGGQGSAAAGWRCSPKLSSEKGLKNNLLVVRENRAGLKHFHTILLGRKKKDSELRQQRKIIISSPELILLQRNIQICFIHMKSYSRAIKS